MSGKTLLRWRQSSPSVGGHSNPYVINRRGAFDVGKLTALLAEKVGKPAFNILRDGHRKEGWRRVRLPRALRPFISVSERFATRATLFPNLSQKNGKGDECLRTEKCWGTGLHGLQNP